MSIRYVLICDKVLGMCCRERVERTDITNSIRNRKYHCKRTCTHSLKIFTQICILTLKLLMQYISDSRPRMLSTSDIHNNKQLLSLGCVALGAQRPIVIKLSCGRSVGLCVRRSVQRIVEKRRIASGCRLSS